MVQEGEQRKLARTRVHWGKFNELAPVSKRGVSLKLYNACVQRVLVISETLSYIARLRRAWRMMVRRMCGVSLKARKRSDSCTCLVSLDSAPHCPSERKVKQCLAATRFIIPRSW